MTLSALLRDTSSVRAAGSSFLLFLARAFAVSFILTKARCLNPAVESGSTSHLFGHRLPSMIHFSDAAIARGSKAPNQPSDELASTILGKRFVNNSSRMSRASRSSVFCLRNSLARILAESPIHSS